MQRLVYFWFFSLNKRPVMTKSETVKENIIFYKSIIKLKLQTEEFKENHHNQQYVYWYNNNALIC